MATVFGASSALAQSTAFTYQGELTDGGQLATGAYDIRFRLYDAAIGGAQIGGQVCLNDVIVVNGRFVALVDFGANFNGQPRFIEIDVRPGAGLDCSTSAGFLTLGARQPMTAAPESTYAIRATNADFATNAGALNGQAGAYYTNAANLTGTLSDARLSSNVPRLNLASTFTAIPSFNGGTSGSSAPFSVSSTFKVNNLNADLLDGLDSTAFAAAAHTHDASAVTTGVFPDARLSSNIPRLNLANTFTAIPSFNGGTSGSSAPFAVSSTFKVNNLNSDFLDGLDSTAFAAASHTHDATAVTTGTLVDARLSSNIPRLNLANTFGATQTLFTTVQTPLAVGSNSTGGTWMNFSNTSTNGRVWNVITTAGGNSEGPGKLLVRDQTAGAVRMTFDTGGNVGIGTTSPGAPLDVQVASGQSLQFRMDSGLIPGIKVNNTGGNAGIMRLRNAMEIWPSDDATRSGRLDMRNTAGNPTITMDGATGNILANNMARAKVSQTYRDIRNSAQWGILDPGVNSDIELLTVNVPADGVLIVKASIQLNGYYIDYNSMAHGYFKLYDRDSSAVLNEVSFGADVTDLVGPVDLQLEGTLTVEWTLNVSAGTRHFGCSLYNAGASNFYYASSSLQAIYLPGGL